MREPGIAGQWTIASGAHDIVTGRARYCPDIQLPGMLTGKLLYSPHACARIKNLDISKARELPGVHAVITHADIPGENSYLYASPDQPILAVDEVRFQGDAVAVFVKGDNKLTLKEVATPKEINTKLDVNKLACSKGIKNL